MVLWGLVSDHLCIVRCIFPIENKKKIFFIFSSRFQSKYCLISDEEDSSNKTKGFMIMRNIHIRTLVTSAAFQPTRGSMNHLPPWVHWYTVGKTSSGGLTINTVSTSLTSYNRITIQQTNFGGTIQKITLVPVNTNTSGSSIYYQVTSST